MVIENNPPLFLSYGPLDTADLAERLHDDLTARGFSIWQDKEDIRVGRDWTDEIAEGLKASKVMVALLSPHSVRRAGLQGSPDRKDSVCLDEIAYAADEVRIPIVPAMALTCEPPFRIYRLHYLDFRSWRESEARYRELLEQLFTAIDNVVAGKPSPLRTLEWLPEPWDFSPFLASKRKLFTGRDWLFEEIDRWRRDETSPALLITGGPGVGKSAIVAQLVHTNPDGQVLAYHCCQADTPATLEPDRFVRSLAAMLASRLDGYAEMLQSPSLREILSETKTSEDPLSAFEAGILAPLNALPEPAEGIRYLLIDALDESMLRKDAPTIVDLLATRLGRLPKWLRIVATTRGEADVLSRLRGLKATPLSAEDPKNVEDVREYISTRLATQPLEILRVELGKSVAEIEQMLLSASAGNFLFVITALDAVEQKLLTFEQIEQLPPGLEALYLEFFDRLYATPGVDFGPSKRVLQAIAAAPEPPTAAGLAAVTGLDEDDELPAIFRRLASFLSVRAGGYRLFHKSLSDWLTGRDNNDQSVAGRYHVSVAKGNDLWATYYWPRYVAGNRPFPANLLRCLPAHLAGARRHDDLAWVLLDLAFLESKVEGQGTSVFDLLADFELAAGSIPEDHSKRSLILLLHEILRLDGQFIGTHPSTLFQCCWNRGWWHDAPLSATYCVAPSNGWSRQGPPWKAAGEKLYRIMERWRADKAARDPGFIWLRSLRPLPEILGSAQRLVLHGHDDGLNCVAISPDDNRIVTAADNGSIKLHDASNGAPLASREYGQEQGIYALGYSPSDDRIVAGLWDGTIRILDPHSLEEIESFASGSEHVYSLAFNPGGTVLAIGGSDGIIRILDATTFQPLCQIQAHDESVRKLVFAPSNGFLASTEEAFGAGVNRVRLWKLDGTLEQIATYESEPHVEDVTFAPDGRHLVWGDYDGNIEFREIGTGDAWRLHDDNDSPAGALAFTPDGTWLLCGAGGAFEDAPIALWNLAERRVVRRLPGHLFSVVSLAFFSDGRRFVSIGDATVRVWDLSAAIDGTDFAPVEPYVDHVIFDRHRPHIITASEKLETVWIRSLDDGTLVARLDGHVGGVHSIALSPDGHRVACGTGNGSVRIWQTATGTGIVSHHIHEDLVSTVAFSPDGRIVASGSHDGTVQLFDVDAGKAVVCFFSHAGDWLQSLVFSDDGSRLASSAQQSIRIHNVPDQFEVSKLDIPGYATHFSLLFVDDGRTLIVEGVADELSAWHCDTGLEVPVTIAHREAFALSKNRTRATWEWDGMNDEPAEGEEDAGHQRMMTLRSVATDEEVAWLPMIAGGVDAHPSGRIWSNRRGNQLWLVALEGGDRDQ